MFTDVGKKIMKLAGVLCVLGIIASVISGIAVIASNSRYSSTILPGILTIIGGSLLSWIGSWTLYAFGQIADDIHEMREHKF